MKVKNCVTGQRIIVKENGNNIPVGMKGIIMQDKGVPYVKIFAKHGETEEWRWYWDQNTFDGVVYEHVTILTNDEMKEDKDVPYLQDVTMFGLKED